ncbi:MAG: hypothetical protein JWM98_272, partial [Thermoleophilia bacterium]|nr:hypothetical protein [Thermoleophilia bacterium]
RRDSCLDDLYCIRTSEYTSAYVST